MTSNNGEEDSQQHPKNKWHDHRPTKLTIAIAGLVIYGFFVFVDAHDIWPWWELAAVVSGVLVTIALLYLEAFVTEAISFRTFVRLSGIVFVGGVLIYLLAPQREQSAPQPRTPVSIFVPVPIPAPPITVPQRPRSPEDTTIPLEDSEAYGVLRPANIPTPPNACDRLPGAHLKPDAIKILIGNNVFVTNSFGVFTPSSNRSMQCCWYRKNTAWHLCKCRSLCRKWRTHCQYQKQ